METVVSESDPAGKMRLILESNPKCNRFRTIFVNVRLPIKSKTRCPA